MAEKLESRSLTVRLPASLYTVLEGLAAKNGYSLSFLVRSTLWAAYADAALKGENDG